MLENFHLVAIVRESSRTRLAGIPLHHDLQRKLADTWQVQYDAFIDDVQEIPFNAGYQPEDHERFCLQSYAPPDWLAEETTQTVSGLNELDHDDAKVDSVRSIAAFARDSAGEELVLFQNFSRSHVIRPGRFLFLQNNTYETNDRAGLTLDSKLSAVFFRAQRKLLFHNFRTVNTFLPLAEFYEEASEQQVRDVLAHRLFAAEDPDALAMGANQWFRKRFALLKDSGVLDRYSAREIEARSTGYDVAVCVSKDRIIFPADRLAAKKLLQFLNEELFRGAITETLYETNSKREAD